MNKILINTIILWVKVIVAMLLSLITVPIVLHTLGTTDYGVYSLVAGVVVLLTFLNVSMAVSTQRYLSVSMGRNEPENVRNVFNTSVFLHLLIGSVVVLLLGLIATFIFDGFLKIPIERIFASKVLYQCLMLSTFLSIISVPYDAVMNAHEDMLIFSIVTIISSILRLLLAIGLIYIPSDKLIAYGIGLTIVSIIEVIIKRSYCKKKYEETTFVSIKRLKKNLFVDMFCFAGWNIIGTAAVLLRNQGIAVVLNLFYSTVMNAAYGIANQLNGVLMGFSGNLQKAVNPQMMKSEGASNHQQMKRLTYFSIKTSELIFALMAVPMIIEMEFVLRLWLKTVPQYTVVFCQLILVMNMLMLFSSAIGPAIQSVGNIRKYTIFIASIILFHVPIACLLLRNGFHVYTVLISMCVVELLVMIGRFVFGRNIAQLSIRYMLQKILLPFMVIYIFAFGSGFLLKNFLSDGFFRLGLIVLCSFLIICCGAYCLLLDEEEKKRVKNLLKTRLTKK